MKKVGKKVSWYKNNINNLTDKRLIDNLDEDNPLISYLLDGIQISQKEAYTKLKNKSGIYGIYVNNRLVYVGCSRDLMIRLYQHKENILKPKDNTYLYKILNEIHNHGQNIYLMPIEYTRNIIIREAYWIDKLKPILNTMLPEYNNGDLVYTPKGKRKEHRAPWHKNILAYINTDKWNWKGCINIYNKYI